MKRLFGEVSGENRLSRRSQFIVPAMLGGIALLVTVLTLFADNPPGIDTPGHLFKAWAIARDAERNFFSTHAWTQYWYNGHPLYHYYPPASYFVIASIDYLLNNIDASYRIFIFLSFLGGSLTAYRLARLWLGRAAAILAALFYVLAPYTMKMVFWEGNVPRTLTLVFVPLLFYLAVRAVDTGERRYFFGLVLTVAALVFTHHMPAAVTLALVSVFLPVYAVRRVPIARLIAVGAALALGLGLTAIWLLPAITHNDLPEVPNLTALPERLPSYSTSPNILLNPLTHWRDANVKNGYLSVIIVIAALAGLVLWKRRRIAVALALTVAFGVFLSMGINTPLYDWFEVLQRWFPERFLQPTVLLLGILAAAGVQSLARLQVNRPVLHSGLILAGLILVLADIAPSLRFTQSQLGRNEELRNVRLAADWLADRDTSARLFSFTARDFATGFLPARVADIDHTAGWNPEGTPHSTSISRLNKALATGNLDYALRTLAIWDAKYALVDPTHPPRARLVDALKENDWREVALPFDEVFLMLESGESSGRLQYNPLAIATVGSGGHVASLVSPNVAEGQGRSFVIEEQDFSYLSQVDTVLLFGYEWRTVAAAEAKLQSLLEGGATLIDALPGHAERLLFDGRAETQRFSGIVKIRNAPGYALLPEAGIDVGPFGYEGGPWSAAVITDGGEPVLVADIDGQEEVVVSTESVSNGRVVRVGLSLLTQAELRGDSNAQQIVRMLLEYDGAETLNPRPFPARDLVWDNDLVSFRYSSDEGATVLLSMTWFPAWHATIDGKPLALFRHERLTLLRLPAGEHFVELRYGFTPFQMKAGAVTLMFALVSGVLALTFHSWMTRLHDAPEMLARKCWQWVRWFSGGS